MPVAEVLVTCTSPAANVLNANGKLVVVPFPLNGPARRAVDGTVMGVLQWGAS
jgi:hypothetical protein